MAGNRGTRPLMVYTSLIFIVAIVMVVVAFFGQRHLESAQIQQTQTTRGITERASQLSDENRILMEQNKELTTEKDTLKEANEELTQQNEALAKEKAANDRLREVQMLIYTGKKSNARKMLKEIYTEDLTAEQKEYYDILVKRSE